MASVQNDIVEIRRTVYGKAMRKPIVDALKHIKDRYDQEGVYVKRLDEILTELNENIIDRIDYVPRTVYVDYEAASTDVTDLTVTNISGDDYYLEDERQDDSVVLIADSDYCLNLVDDSWAQEEMEEESYIVYDRVERKESYIMILDLV